MKQRNGFTTDREKNRTGFNLAQDEVEKTAALKAELDKNIRLDSYDRARHTLAFMNSISTTGQIPDDYMASFYVAIAVTEGLLAIADALYTTRGMSREPEEKE